jgi:hypothetical protein
MPAIFSAKTELAGGVAWLEIPPKKGSLYKLVEVVN